MHFKSNRSASVHLSPILDDQDVCSRVLGEFREMPGLTLTLPQAVRLFNLRPAPCERILRRLVQNGMLVSDGRVFRRAHGITGQ